MKIQSNLSYVTFQGNHKKRSHKTVGHLMQGQVADQHDVMCW